MYAYLRGLVQEKGADYCVLDVNQVGYLVKISLSVCEMLPPVGEEVTFYIHTAVKEDDISLYGFLSREDLELFKKLIQVSGVGPKGAQSILGTIPADSLRFAIASGDFKAISKAPGIGSKMAQKIILELKDKISLGEAIERTLEAGENAGTAAVSSGVKEAREALVALGYSASDALKAISKVENADTMDTESILKAALKHMF